VNPVISLVAVAVLFLVGYFGSGAGLAPVLGIALPYAAVALFLVGLIWRVLSWAQIPVPFRIPTSCGQQKTLSWIKPDKYENPHSFGGVVVRMALEVLLFRSLLRNSQVALKSGGRVGYMVSLGLWAGALAFHWSMLMILMRHARFFLEPVPSCVHFLHLADGFPLRPVMAPVLYISSILFIGGVAFLLYRRLADPQVRYISLAGDYFPLFLLLGIGGSGLWMRHLSKTDVTAIKDLSVGWVTFGPSVSESIAPLFFGHLILVCVLLAYIPFSKICHMAGIFLSPTRNLVNNNRAVRYVNPWDYPVKTHPYEEYEDEWREKMKGAGVPVDKE
jgi:nitrate reductase gamma subunit